MTRFDASALPKLAKQRAVKISRRISLYRLVLIVSVAVGLLLCLAVATILLLNARRTINEEVNSAFRTAQTTAASSLPSAVTGQAAMDRAIRLSEEINTLRHVSSQIVDSNGEPVRTQANGISGVSGVSSREVPSWFIELIRPQVRTNLLPISHYSIVSDSLLISTNPSDEIANVWEGFRIIMPLWALTGFALVGLIMTLSALVLRRLRLVQEVISAIRQGDLSRRAPDDFLIEFAALAGGVNNLANHLQAEQSENDRLHKRLLSHVEAERTKIASDLHDEMGPQLFAMNAALAQAQVAAEGLTGESRLQLGEALRATAIHTHAIADSARAAITDLRPMIQGHSSLSESLAELVADFTEIAPNVMIRLASDYEAQLGELAELSIYRFVRESVLNAIRHGHASRIEITMCCNNVQPQQIITCIADNGRGPSDTLPIQGYGLVGIRDRARALGATYLPPYRMDNMIITELRMPSR